MQKKLSFKKSFLKIYDELPAEKQSGVQSAIQDLIVYFKTGRAAAGLGVKRLAERTWEFRVGIHVRVIYIDTGTEIVLAFIGSHDDVRKFLKRH